MKENIIRLALIGLLLISLFFNFKLSSEVTKQKELAASAEELTKESQAKLSLMEAETKNALAKSQALYDKALAKSEELKTKR